MEATMATRKSSERKKNAKISGRKALKKRTRRAWNRPIKEEQAVKRYVVRLSAEERSQLEDKIRKGKGAARHILKARILLKADVSEAGEAWSDRRIAEALNTNMWTLWQVRKQLVEEGFDAVFTRKKRETPPVPRIFDGEKEAKLIALACSKPPAGYASWTLRLLENKVVELEIVDKASDSTIGRVLKKTFSNPTKRNSGSFRPRAAQTS